jgi:hypothetical protein
MSFLSLKSRLLFLHLYKNAGSSIEAALQSVYLNDLTLQPAQLTPVPVLNRLIHNKLLLRSGYVALPIRQRGLPRLRALSAMERHLPLKRFEENIDLGSVHSFAVVRNPWSWQVSLYNYASKTPFHYQYGAPQYASFDSYIRWRCSSQIRLQSTFVSNHAGVCGVNTILRLESLQDDWADLRARQGWGLPDLPYLNSTRHSDYRNYYTDDLMLIVAEAFAADIAAFKYTFDC